MNCVRILHCPILTTAMATFQTKAWWREIMSGEGKVGVEDTANSWVDSLGFVF